MAASSQIQGIGSRSIYIPQLEAHRSPRDHFPPTMKASIITALAAALGSVASVLKPGHAVRSASAIKWPPAGDIGVLMLGGDISYVDGQYLPGSHESATLLTLLLSSTGAIYDTKPPPGVAKEQFNVICRF